MFQYKTTMFQSESADQSPVVNNFLSAESFENNLRLWFCR